MVAISRSKVKLWILPVDTNASTLVSSAVFSTSAPTGYLAGEIKSYNKSGGEDDVESDPVFGGFVDKEKPTSQFELSFEIIPDINVAGGGNLNWESLLYAENDSDDVYTTKAKGAARAIFIQASDASGSKSWAFNNCSAISLDMEHSADDNLMYTLNFKFSPTDSAGVPNFQYTAQAVTNLVAWASLETE